MSKIKRVLDLIVDPVYRFYKFNEWGFYKNMDDLDFLPFCYKKINGDSLNLDSPSTFNEKINWLKIYNRDPVLTKMVDKYEAKQYFLSKVEDGEKYIIPTYGVWDSFDDIDFDSLPSKFVMKCTHNSGCMDVINEKTILDYNALKRKYEKELNTNYYHAWREWAYKNVKPRIIVEKLMEDPNQKVLNVYKFFCFNDGDSILQAIQGDKTSEERIDYFDSSWNKLDLYQNFQTSEMPLDRPVNFELMLKLSKQLSEGFPFLRVDFYEINKNLYFSEFTFYSDAGMMKFHPQSWDAELGKRIALTTG